MSTAARPKTEPEPVPPATDAGPDADGWALLDGLRRRIDDQGAQGRKTQQQVTQLAESIGALVELQRRRTRGLNLNSFIAYLIFTMLCGTGFYFVYRTRARELMESREQARVERDAAVRRADDGAAKLAAREQADARAWDIYQLLEAGKLADASAKLGSVGDLPLSRTERAVLAARAHETQVMAVEAALKAAALAFKQGRAADVIAPLEAALVGEPAGARASTMHYYLGVAYAKTNDLPKAVVHLQAAVTAEVDQEDARFQLASALDRSGQYAKARGEYDRFATAHPQSQLAVFAMRRSGTLARMPAVAPTPAVPKTPIPAPGAATTVPPAPTSSVPTPSTTVPPTPATTRPPAAAPTMAKPAPTPAAKPTTVPPPVAKPAPAPTTAPLVAPPKLSPAPAEGSDAATAAPMSTPPLDDRPPPTSPAPPPLPPTRTEPPPSPLEPTHDREPSPQPPIAQRPVPAPSPIEAQPSLLLP